jgi:hypothetical protein
VSHAEVASYFFVNKGEVILLRCFVQFSIINTHPPSGHGSLLLILHHGQASFLPIT